MDARIIALEKDVATIKADVAVIRSNYASKEDLHKELHATTWKIIGAIGIGFAAVFWLARNVEPPRQLPQQTTFSPQSSAAAAATVPPAPPAQK